MHHYVVAGIDPMSMVRARALRSDVAAEYEWAGNLSVDDEVDDYDPRYGSTDYQKTRPGVYARGGLYDRAGVRGEGVMLYTGGSR